MFGWVISAEEYAPTVALLNRTVAGVGQGCVIIR